MGNQNQNNYIFGLVVVSFLFDKKKRNDSQKKKIITRFMVFTNWRELF